MRWLWMTSSGAVLSGVLLGSAMAWGQAPAATPRSALFDRVGVISAVEPAAGTITVNDRRYVLSPSLRVYTYERAAATPQALRAETRRQAPHALRQGVRIGFTVVKEEGDAPGEMTEAWLLPAGRLPEIDPPARRTPSPR